MSDPEPAGSPRAADGCAARRGALRVYLGAAPGVGKTYAMLNEGRRRVDRGADVVVGFVEDHGRAQTAAQVDGLEVIPRRTLEYRGSSFEEMDLAAVLARRPELALVDELAHSNVPGSRNEKRWQDVEELLAAGIDVLSTVNVQHLESLNDVVERITGVRQRETLPDEVLRSADQVELVDMTPEALRRRMAHGNIYGPEKVDAALTNYFRPGNLAALRELALLWVADRVDEALERYRAHHGITDQWETRERIVIAVTGAAGTEDLVRRAARIAQRAHGEIIGVHVRGEDGLVDGGERVEPHRRLIEELGGTLREVAGGDIAAALVDFARAENATQIVLGASRRSRWNELVRGSVINRVVKLSGAIDVHVISHTPPDDAVATTVEPPRRASALAPRRRLMGWVLAAVGTPLLTLLLANLRDHMELPGVLLLYLLLVVCTAALGGWAPAVAVAIVGFLCANWFFTPPIHTWTIAEAENLLALVVFLAVAMIVSGLVASAARRAAEAARATAEAATLAGVAGTLAEPDPLPALLDNLRRAFGLTGASLLRRRADGLGWQLEAMSGPAAPATPEGADETLTVGDDLVLALVGARLAAEDRRVLKAFVLQLGAAVERRRLHSQAAQAAALAEADQLRTAFLQAVSHDLRTPLAGIKASASSLRQPDVAWSTADVNEFLRTIEDETDRLTDLVANLLDMSRIQVGAVRPQQRDVGLDEVVPGALAGLGERARDVVVDVAESLPPVRSDPAMLERVVANLVDNALAHGGEGTPVRVEAGAVGGRVLIRVIDQGPGIPEQLREGAFEPFRQLGVGNGTAGVGLGLAVARGFTQAMGGDLSIEDTPGGGTTVVVELEAVL